MIENVLEERGNSYGNYNVNVEAIANIMDILNTVHFEKTGQPLSGADRVNLEYQVIKLVRLGATPSHKDSWIDVQGYGKLAEIYYSQPMQTKMDI